MTRGTEIVDWVIAELSKITKANNFNTDAGLNISRGRPENTSANQYQLPVIIVSTTASTNAAVRPNQVRKEREIQIIGIIDADSRDYEPEMDDLDEDITRVLASLTDPDNMQSTISLTVTGGDFDHPDAGSNLASISHTVTVSYSLTTKP